MSILDHAGIPEVLRRLYELEMQFTRIAVEFAELTAFHGCCGTDRPEDCGDCLCPEQRRWAEMERSTESTTLV